MEIAEMVFFILTFCSGMIGIFSSILGFTKTGFDFMVVTAVFGMITLYFSDKNTFK